MRADGYHDLVSLVSPVEFGDELHVELTTGREITLVCDDPALATDESNLIVRAAMAFKRQAPFEGGARFVLKKRIPLGAGLGGGSSNAAAALLALNRLTGSQLAEGKLSALAAEVGSDCALFLAGDAVVMRGRGEIIDDLPLAARSRLVGRKVWIIKPSVGVSTPWAYRMLAAEAPRSYLPAVEAEHRLGKWIDTPALPLSSLLFNSFEPVVFRKFIALPLLLKQLADAFGFAALLSGSGSACFLFAREGSVEPPAAAVEDMVRSAWGPEAFVVETRLRHGQGHR